MVLKSCVCDESMSFQDHLTFIIPAATHILLMLTKPGGCTFLFTKESAVYLISLFGLNMQGYSPHDLTRTVCIEIHLNLWDK